MGGGGNTLMPFNAATTADTDAVHAGLADILNCTTDTASCSTSVYDWPAPDDDPEDTAKTPRQGGGGRKSLSDSVKRRIRQLYRTFSRHGVASGGCDGSDTELSPEAAAAAAVAAAVAATEPPSPRARPPPVTVEKSSRPQQQQQALSSAVNLNNNSDLNRRSLPHCLGDARPQLRLHASMSNSILNENRPLRLPVPLDSRLSSSTTSSGASASRPPGAETSASRPPGAETSASRPPGAEASASRPPGAEATPNKDDDLYTELTIDADELANFYSGIFVVAECEGKVIKTATSKRLEDMQTSFLFYRRSPTKEPINFKMFADHLTLGRRVLIGELNLTLQPGEAFDGMCVRRSFRERPELRADGGSGMMFNFVTGTHHTQHLSGV